MMSFKGKKILVTGGTGFIGSHIANQLLELNAHIRIPVHSRELEYDHDNIEAVRADLMKVDDCHKLSFGIDYIIHAAGTVGSSGVTGYRIMEGISKNLIITVQLLQAAWKEKVKRIIVFGSSTGYPAYNHPVKEDEMWMKEPFHSYFGYGWMRRYFEKLGEFISKESESKVIVIRPSAVYGPGDNFREETSHVIPALIKRAIRKENPFVVWGTGKEVRDFLHVSDFSRGCINALNECSDFQTINIGSGRITTIQEVVETVIDVTGHDDASIVYDDTKPVAIPFRAINIEKAKHLIGFEPKIDLKAGIIDTFNWYLNKLSDNQ